MEQRTMKSIFVAMPFKPEYNPVLDTIKRAARMLNMSAIQVGDENYTGSIISHIRNAIQKADAMVAIASEENGNVYYEIGLAHCQQKPVAILTSDPNQLKFDLRDHRAIRYDPSSPDKILEELVATLNEAIITSDDPHDYFQGIFRGRTIEQSVHQGITLAVRTLVSEFHLQEPVEVTHLHRSESGGMSIAVVDFMGAEIRAVMDINGIIRDMRRM